MNRTPALIATALLLSLVVAGTTFSAILYVPQKSFPVHAVTTTITAHPIATTTAQTSNSSSSTANQTELIVSMHFPNGSSSDSGVLYAGTQSVNSSNGEYNFSKITPGIYPLSLKKASNVYLSPTNVQLSSGVNHVDVLVYAVSIFVLYFNNGLSINGTQPGPPIIVSNASAVELVIFNNTTLIHNLGIVESLTNQNSSNVLFDSLSLTLNAGGSTNDTFVVNKSGSYYYEDLIGNHGHDGDYGSFYVLS
jgi:hypothetical protein